MVQKIDFHLHTLPKDNGKDEIFDFSEEWLENYVKFAKLNAIAITNHNLFNKENYDYVKRFINNVNVFPGMEIDLENGHINLVYPNEDKYIDDLVDASEKLKSIKKDSYISINEFFDIFKYYKDSILIFENGKSKSLKKQFKSNFENITTLEGVPNGLKFQKIWNKDENIIPVLFSDGHATENGNDVTRSNINDISKKNTFVQSDSNAFNDLKNALSNKNSVNIYKNNVHDTFEINNIKLSTGLNLVVGRRGTGKTHFLDEVEKQSKDSYYRISQFESTEQKEFLERETNKKTNEVLDDINKKYETQINSIKELLSDQNSTIPDDYLDKLKKYSEDLAMSKGEEYGLFKNQNFDILDINWIGDNLKKIKDLIISEQLWNYIKVNNNYKKNLISLYKLIKNNYKNDFIKNKEKEYINILILNIKKTISKSTGQSTLPSIEFTKIIRRRKLISSINNWINSITEEPINNHNIMNYTIQTNIKKFNSANELKKYKRTSLAVSDAFKFYEKNEYFEYLLMMKNKDLINDQIINSLFCIKTILLNENGKNASGGQSVALSLILSLEEAKNKDIILIDEPEASLDNAFIKDNLINKLKDLAKDHTVFVVTHNSTLGAMLNPDYLIVCKKDEQDNYDVLSGEYSSKTISNNKDNKKINSYEDFLDAMEAGMDSFEKKGKNYNELRIK